MNAIMRRIIVSCLCAIIAVTLACARGSAFEPAPFQSLQHDIRSLARQAPGRVALAIEDLATGFTVGYDAGAAMPAASTIKVPVMVEVFQQVEDGRFTLNRPVTLLARDKDWGSGELCDAAAGTTFTVSALLHKMIDISDNTATNMLIRLIGRQNVNREMWSLGLRRTYLANDIRTDHWAVRTDLRSSPGDMVALLSQIAQRRLIDGWASEQMLAILSEQEYNTLLPALLPPYVQVAHKTGSLDDTLNDVGVVFAPDASYAIAVMTTQLGDLDAGRHFIRMISRSAFNRAIALARWREAAGIDATVGASSADVPVASPDVTTWLSRGDN